MFSRRRLFAAAAGIAVGIVGSATTRSDASIRFLGRGSSILALLDTGTERALFALGAPDNRLIADTAGLTTIGRSRVDLVVATHRTLATDIARKHMSLDTAQILSVQSDASLPPIQGAVHLASHSLELTLGNTTKLTVTAGVNPTDHPDFLVEIECLGRRLLISSSASALRTASGSGHDLLVLPGEASADDVNRVRPQVVVGNYRGEEEIDTVQIEVFPTDPIVVGIRDEGISVRRNQLSS